MIDISKEWHPAQLVMHQSFVTTAGLMCGAVTFPVPPQCRVSAGLVVLRKYTPMEFTIIRSRATTPSKTSQCMAFSRAVMDEKSLSPLFPIGGGGGRGVVVTMTSA